MSRELDALIHFLFLIGAIICWLSVSRRQKPLYIYYCGLFLWVTFVFDGIAVIIMLNRYLESNLFLYHILTPIQLSIILIMYYHVIKNRIYKRAVPWLIPVLVLLSVSFSFTIQPITENNSYSILIKHVFVIISTLIYFFELISTTPYSKIYIQPIFWISVGLLFHSSLNILLEGFSNYLNTYSEPKYGSIYLLYSFSNYCLFFLIGAGLIISKTKSVGHESESYTKY